MSDLIERIDAIRAIKKFSDEQKSPTCQRWMNKACKILLEVPRSTEDIAKVIHCKDCMYYDPPHIDKDSERYEYEDMPPEAFDALTKKYVSAEYGINVGGRCCRDYERGYSEDKRVFVNETNYCGRAVRVNE